MDFFTVFLVSIFLIIISILLVIIFSKNKIEKSNRNTECIHFKFSLSKNTYAELDYQIDTCSSSADPKKSTE